MSDAGTTRDYKLFTMLYPEFTSLKIGGVTAKLTRNAFYQDLLTYNVELPAGTDISHAVLEFSINNDVKFYVDDTEVTHGKAIDLTKEDAKYTLKSIHPEQSNITATSNVILNVTFK